MDNVMRDLIHFLHFYHLYLNPILFLFVEIDEYSIFLYLCLFPIITIIYFN